MTNDIGYDISDKNEAYDWHKRNENDNDIDSKMT